ncbi:MAG: recombinase family protein [Acidimicrobiales bacterium]
MRAAIYTRISHDPTGEQTATSRQEMSCRQLCEIRGWDVDRAFEDVDISAYSGDERPAFIELRKAVVCGDIDIVVVWKLDRLVRRPVEFEAFWALAEEAGVAVVSATEPIDTSSEFGLAMVRVLIAMASMESATSGLRLRARYAQRVHSGLPPNASQRGFGYTRDRLTIIGHEADLIREAADRVIAGESCYSIAKDYTARGVTTVTGRNFNTSGLRAILLSDRIVGDINYLGEVVSRGTLPAIVDRLTHARAREALNHPDRRQYRQAPRGLLTRGLLRCGICGGTMRSSTTYNHNDRPRIYICPGEPLGCQGVSIRMARADEAVTDALFERLDVMFGHELGRPHYGPDEEIVLLDAIADTNQRLHELTLDRYYRHLIDRHDYLIALTKLRSRLHRLRRRLRSPALHLLTGSNPQHLHDRWDQLDTPDQRLAINAVLDHATVLPATAEGRRNPAIRLRYAWHCALVEQPAFPRRPQRRWTDTEILDALTRCAHETGATAINNYRAWTKGRPDAPSETTVIRRIGSWPQAEQLQRDQSIRRAIAPE